MSFSKQWSTSLLASLCRRPTLLFISDRTRSTECVFAKFFNTSCNTARPTAFKRSSCGFIVLRPYQADALARTYKNFAHNIEKRPRKSSYLGITFGVLAIIGLAINQFDWIYIGHEFPQLRFDLWPPAHETYLRAEHLKQELDYEHGIESLPLTLWTEREKREFNLKPQYLPPDAPPPSYTLPAHLQPSEPQRQDYWLPADEPLPKPPAGWK